MTASLRTLLSGVLDYAGLFPPAKLPLDEAFANYLRYRAGPNAWMLGRFVIPAVRLCELREYSHLLTTLSLPIALAVLGQGGDTCEKIRDGLESDLNSVVEFRRQYAERVVINALEVRLPVEAAVLPAALSHLLCDIERRVVKEGLSPFTLFLEESHLGPKATPPHAVQTYRGIDMTWDDTDKDYPLGTLGLGVKLRCGGVDATAIPPVDQVARTLVISMFINAKLKFTGRSAPSASPLRPFAWCDDARLHQPVCGRSTSSPPPVRR